MNPIKKYFLSITLILISLNNFIFADVDNDIDVTNMSDEQIPAQESKGRPFSLDVHFDAVKTTDIRKGYYKDDSVQFAEGQATLGLIYYYCPRYTEGLGLTVGYERTIIRWEHNPWFNQELYNTANLSFTGFTKRLHKWFWRGQLDINIDADHIQSSYMFYNLLIWGRYELCQDIGFHVGFIAQTGMQMDRVYPILGIDWQISRRWKLNLVFPVNVSLEYLITSRWSIAIAGRAFDSRHRVSNKEPHPRYLVRYTNAGGELAIKYDDTVVSANIHAGYTLGGDLRIANPHNHHPHHYKLDPSGYAGAEVVVKF